MQPLVHHRKQLTIARLPARCRKRALCIQHARRYVAECGEFCSCPGVRFSVDVHATTPRVLDRAISGTKSKSCSPIVALTPTNARCWPRGTNETPPAPKRASAWRNKRRNSADPSRSAKPAASSGLDSRNDISSLNMSAVVVAPGRLASAPAAITDALSSGVDGVGELR